MGTRGSLLARGQSTGVAQMLTSASGCPVRPVIVRTEGDDVSVPLHSPRRPGVFVATLRDRLLAGDIDFVVHSYKDLPSAPVAGLVVAAVPARVDPRDAVVTRDGLALAQLPAGSRIGTSSPRRVAALRRSYPDLVAVPIRGNVDTRLGRVAAGDVDAVVLALAGLLRMGRDGLVTEVLDPAVMVPAPAQGALAVECRTDDVATLRKLQLLDNAEARITVAAERSVLAGVDAACTTAIGAVARFFGATETGHPLVLELTAEIADHRGVQYQRIVDQVDLPAGGGVAGAGALGARVALALLS
jgi:hydroxymethylbilane synthase